MPTTLLQVLSVALGTAAAELDARAQAMANRAGVGVSTAVAGAATLLALQAHYCCAIHAKGEWVARWSRGRLDDAIEEAHAGHAQLHTIAAVLAAFPSAPLRAIVCGLADAWAFNAAAFCVSWDVSLAAPLAAVYVASLHVLISDIDPLRCELSGTEYYYQTRRSSSSGGIVLPSDSAVFSVFSQLEEGDAGVALPSKADTLPRDQAALTPATAISETTMVSSCAGLRLYLYDACSWFVCVRLCMAVCAHRVRSDDGDPLASSGPLP